ncbi:hypothetical protein Leryth_010095, partial [Lithospermum erythrorhizon]
MPIMEKLRMFVALEPSSCCLRHWRHWTGLLVHMEDS